ncbi:MAG: glucose-6-phosphate isomerase [Burkholderiaceae bacterium]|nr:glucose-6-phosphate isomerase [Burkholderiaceae bacterium]
MKSPDPARRPRQDYRKAVAKLRKEARAAADTDILALYDAEPDRLERLCFDVAGLHIDLSRQRFPLTALDTFGELVAASGLAGRRAAMFAGEAINFTEGRAAFHVALRAAAGTPRPLGKGATDVAAEVDETLGRMREFARRVREGEWTGAHGRPVTDVVNVGIGGSQLGPLLACDALAAYRHPRLRTHFLANIDPDAWARLKASLVPDTTLVVIASKSWRTLETARNAQAVRDWLIDGGIEEPDLAHHLVGVTANPEGARAFGLADEGIFPFSDWVGGRYSLWSAIGLPVMLAIGPQGFDAMLAGAHAMDRHFDEAPWQRNAPLMMALLTLWNADALGSQTEAVIPYAQALARLPAYLQQLQMESNGKSVDIDGKPILTPPAPVIWGEPGTDAQHSFFQQLHQGPQPQPVDFVLVQPAPNDPQGRSLGLAANALAQAEALLRGAPDAGDPHRRYPGNRPSSTILLEALDPACFGALLALYEHKTAALGWLMRINSFDQWGVELGKQIAARHEALLADLHADLSELDPSTADLLVRMRRTLLA